MPEETEDTKMASKPVIHCNKTSLSIPGWAYLERTVFTQMDKALDIILDKYLAPDGQTYWPTWTPEEGGTGNSADDVYESFHSWPLFYLLGGAERFLSLSYKEYDAVSRQLSKYPDAVDQEFFAWGDWMHIGEGMNFFYMMNLADPKNPVNIERSKRFAGFYLGTDPKYGDMNFDPVHKVMKGSVTGAWGAKPHDKPTDGFRYDPNHTGAWFEYYNLPYYDLGMQNWLDLEDPENARRMGEAYEFRFHAGDSPTNLLSTSLMMNAYLHDNNEQYKQWILDYAGTWRRLTEENNGVIPDNCGPNGKMGECMDGKWYGGYYGWAFPHGFMFIAEGIAVAAENETLLTGDRTKLNWLTQQTEKLLERKIEVDGTVFVPYKYAEPGSDIQYIGSDKEVMTEPGTIPERPDFRKRIQVDGWYEFNRLNPSHLTHAWFVNFNEHDKQILWETRDNRYRGWEQIDMSRMDSFESYPMSDAYGFPGVGSKNMGGQHMGLMGYHMGTFPDYPETILKHNLNQMYFRLSRMYTDPQPKNTYGDSYLQHRNPISVEGLVHLTMGGPLPLYNGGLLMVSLMYFDPKRQRPGLPEDVAALISHVEDEKLTLELVNVHPLQSRTVTVQSGAYGEHTIHSVLYDGEETPVNASRFDVELAPGTHAVMELKLSRYVNTPRYHTWDE